MKNIHTCTIQCMMYVHKFTVCTSIVLQGDHQLETKAPPPTDSVPAAPPPSHSSPPPSLITASHHIHSTPLPPSPSTLPTLPPSHSPIPTTTHSHTATFLHDSQPNGDLVATERLPSPLRQPTPDNGAIATLQKELDYAEEEKRELKSELEALKDRQARMLDETRNAVARTYQDQIVNLQHSLVENQRSHQLLERQLTELRNRHGSEMESVRRQQEVARVSALKERDRKHSEHILRLTAELSAQQEFVDGGKDSAEQEAERIQLIKVSMKEMHEKEKAQLIEAHEEEKRRLAEEHQEKLVSHTQQMEQLANSKIQEVHGQIMSAYQTLAEQKSVAESELGRVRDELQQTSSRLAVFRQEKEQLEEENRRLLETHSAEVEEMNTNARNLEERVNSWKEKAASLETHLRLSGETEEHLQQLREDYEAKLQGLTAQFGEQVARLESDAKRQRERNETLVQQLQSAEEDARVRYQEELETLQSEHGSQVELLEKSMSEALGDKASLEAAEEHMSSLQKQLKAYRMQESDMNARMTRLREEQAEVLELLKRRHEKEKEEELESLRGNFVSQIEELQRELQEERERAGEDTSNDALQELRSTHREELQRLQSTLQQTQAEALDNLQAQLLKYHKTNMEHLKQQHESEVQQVKSEFESASEQVAEMEAESKEKFIKLQESHSVEVSRLQTEHGEAIRELQVSFEHQRNLVLSEANSRVQKMESELVALRNKEDEWQELQGDMMSKMESSQREIERGRGLLAQAESTESQLREQCRGLSERLRSAESDCSIAQSARVSAEQSLVQVTSQLGGLRGQVEHLQVEAEKVEAAEAASHEQAEKLLRVTDQLAEKNMAIANLQSETDTLNTEVFSLTRKCQQQASTVEMLQRQLENAGAESEEIARLQQQLSELAPVKEYNAQLKITVTQLQAIVRSKEQLHGEQVEELTTEVERLKEDVEAAHTARREQEEHSTAELRTLQSDNDLLNGRVSSLTTECEEKTASIEMLEQQLSPVNQQNAQLKQLVAQLEDTVQSKDGTIGELQSNLEQVQGQVSRLEMAIQSKDGELGHLETEIREQNRLKEEAERLRSALQSKDTEIKSLQEAREQVDFQLRELKIQSEAQLEEATANSAREIEALRATNEAQGARESELRGQITQQDVSLAQLESTLQAQQEELASAREEVSQLQGRLQESVATGKRLREENQTLAAELEAQREQSASVQSDSLVEMRSRNEELEQSLSDLESERAILSSELARAREESGAQFAESTRSWESKVQQMEQSITELHRKLSEKDVAFAEMQNLLTQKLAEAEIHQQSLRRSLDNSQLHSPRDGTLVLGQRSALEESLSRARRRLSEKLREKDTLERDLSFHQTELERRLGEKQRLEELLFEKARFEQELMNQKEQLQSDLIQVESKLHLHVGRVGQQYSNHMVTPPNQRLLTHS